MINYRVMVGFIKRLRGNYRISLGFCPLCNSDAPEVYDCPLCEGYQQARGDKYPPTKETKRAWSKSYNDTIKMWIRTYELILKNRNR